ncbi:MAG: hypothetical protein ABR502_10890 [Chitinophagaceae bacterium]
MKTLFIALTILASVFTKTFAADEKIAPRVLKSFQETFVNAKEVDWSSTATYYKAQFSLNDQIISAFYDMEGVLIGLTRNITTVQLPVSLQATLKKNYQQYWISELFEVSNDEGTQYYVTMETADVKVILKASPNSNWGIYQKQCKS